jgi:maltooligosyltrehalose trehalohydrolase
VARRIPDPAAPETFELCKLAPFSPAQPQDDRNHPAGLGALARREHQRRTAALALHRDLLRLRRDDPVFRLQGEAGLDGAVLGPGAFVLRFFAPPAAAGDGFPLDRLLLVNLGRDLHLGGPSEPLLAPPLDARWEPLWSSEELRYGGSGAPPPEDAAGRWHIPGQAAVALRPVGRGVDPAPAEQEEATA